MKIDAYLERIGLSKELNLPPTLETLQKLQYQHVTHVPYENLDLVHGKSLSFDEGSLYQKIVTEGRGGYCFELNALYAALLRKLGYTVKNYFARYLRGVDEIPIRRHRILCVSCEGKEYICDVGVGQSAPRWPLLFEEGLVQSQFGESYRFQKDSGLGWVLQDFYKGEWRSFYSFTEEEQFEVDFIPTSYYCETHPDSMFNKVYMLSIKTETGRITLDDRCYKEFADGKLVYIEENLSDEKRLKLMEEKFYIKGEAI